MPGQHHKSRPQRKIPARYNGRFGSSLPGLTRYYRALWELAGRPRSADHVLWLRLFDPAEAADGDASSAGDADRILTVEAFQEAIQSDSGLVITDAAAGTTFHAGPRSCPHVRQESFEEKVIENGERNGSYFVASSFAEAKERWPEARRCVSSACTSLV